MGHRMVHFLFSLIPAWRHNGRGSNLQTKFNILRSCRNRSQMTKFTPALRHGIILRDVGHRGWPCDVIACSNLKMDFTIEFFVIKIPRVSIFSNLCHFSTKLLTLTTLTTPGSAVDPNGINFNGHIFSRSSRFFGKSAKCFVSLYVTSENLFPLNLCL